METNSWDSQGHQAHPRLPAKNIIPLTSCPFHLWSRQYKQKGQQRKHFSSSDTDQVWIFPILRRASPPFHLRVQIFGGSIGFEGVGLGGLEIEIKGFESVVGLWGCKEAGCPDSIKVSFQHLGVHGDPFDGGKEVIHLSASGRKTISPFSTAGDRNECRTFKRNDSDTCRTDCPSGPDCYMAASCLEGRGKPVRPTASLRPLQVRLEPAAAGWWRVRPVVHCWKLCHSEVTLQSAHTCHQWAVSHTSESCSQRPSGPEGFAAWPGKLQKTMDRYVASIPPRMASSLGTSRGEIKEAVVLARCYPGHVLSWTRAIPGTGLHAGRRLALAFPFGCKVQESGVEICRIYAEFAWTCICRFPYGHAVRSLCYSKNNNNYTVQIAV